VYLEAVNPSDTQACDWRDCRQPAAYRVSPSPDTTTGVRLLCEEHANLVQTMSDEVRDRRR
jgi:hypothetical protein